MSLNFGPVSDLVTTQLGNAIGSVSRCLDRTLSLSCGDRHHSVMKIGEHLLSDLSDKFDIRVKYDCI